MSTHCRCTCRHVEEEEEEEEEEEKEEEDEEEEEAGNKRQSRAGGEAERRRGWVRKQHLEGSSTQDHGSIVQCVLDGTQAVSDGVLDLRQGVVCRALYEYGAGGRVPYILHKTVLVFTQNMLIHLASIPAEHVDNLMATTHEAYARQCEALSVCLYDMFGMLLSDDLCSRERSMMVATQWTHARAAVSPQRN